MVRKKNLWICKLQFCIITCKVLKLNVGLAEFISVKVTFKFNYNHSFISDSEAHSR